MSATGTNAGAAEGPLCGPWHLCARPPGVIGHPDQLGPLDGSWLSAEVPGTVASALRNAGLWDLDCPADLDGQDWWYRTEFAAPALEPGRPCRLTFEGLATLGEVWLNGRLLLRSENAFRAYSAEVGPFLRPVNELVLGFRSLAEDLKRKRPRPRWKTNLVSHQQLRWHRCSLLGRIPGWAPTAAVVGPWRPARLDTRPAFPAEVRVTARLEGRIGTISLSGHILALLPVTWAILRVEERTFPVAAVPAGDGWRLQARAEIADPPLWWPHTHGPQPLLKWALEVTSGPETTTVAAGKVGFREVAVSTEGGFSLSVNGTPVYCRGVCWTVSDLLSPGTADPARDLLLARDAGANMLRSAGTMGYENDEFYRLCDELGILVWQDFPFASMDYPVEDPDFAANIEAEARCQLSRLSAHPSLAVLCGNSEVEQQAALFGVPAELWRNSWFASRLPELCEGSCPGVAYVPSTPSGGTLPFHSREGTAHYFGVGAYLRPPGELRQAAVKFASECLAFSNLPEPELTDEVRAGGPAVWKRRIPRDVGAGWDFEDVRDFYFRLIFNADPVQMRCFDPGRYLELSRVVPGEMMARVFAEWRGGHSSNAGGLVWFFKDLSPGAGWGLLDSTGCPKAAYYQLHRAWQTRQLTLTDEGLEGLHLHASNEEAEPFNGSVEVLLLREGHVLVARGEAPCRLPSGGRATFSCDTVLGGFFDVNHVYRFGPPQHDVVAATLLDGRGQVLSEAFHFVRPAEPAYLAAVNLEAEASREAGGCYRVSLRCDRLLQYVSLSAKGFLPDDNYFHLLPGRQKFLRCRPLGEATRFRASLAALNLRGSLPIRPQETPPESRRC